MRLYKSNITRYSSPRRDPTEGLLESPTGSKDSKGGLNHLFSNSVFKPFS